METHFFVHKEHIDWRLRCIVSHHEWKYQCFQCHRHQQVNPKKPWEHAGYKKGKLCINFWQVDSTEQAHALWPAKFCPKAGANMFSIMCELLQRNKISRDHQNNIVVKSIKGNIILDCQIKTWDDCIARIEFLQETVEEWAQSGTVSCKKNINDLHIEIGHPSESISHAITKDMGIQVMGTFKLCEDCALGMAKHQGVSKQALAWSKFLKEKLLFNLNTLSLLLLVVRSMGYWS